MPVIGPETVGGIAGALTTLSFIPQVLKIHRERHAGGVSLGMYGIFALGILLWLIYGLLIVSPSIIAANAVTLALALTVILLKLRHG
jgi:MtN3 and saliva related transmembrane protein